MSDRRDPSSSVTTALAIRNVRRSFYGAEVRRGVGFDIPTVELTGLIGPAGPGKSTLSNVLSGFSRSDGGCILVNGTECARVRCFDRYGQPGQDHEGAASPIPS
jgi:ABC-type branched-subunit amino acid transport system ATPase component